MRLANFIETREEAILQVAMRFAQTIPALRHMEDKVLRDHLPGLLRAISLDLRTPQTRTESIEKSQGEGPEPISRTAAQTHGLMRAKEGISIDQLVAEFRALRSSVLRLWGEASDVGPEAVEDIARFNEAIDQAVAESVEFFSHEKERWRQIFLGVLGHDLRVPLNAIGLTTELMRMQKSAPPAQTALLLRGVRRATTLLDSLLEYSRSGLGVGMVLHRARIDLAEACADEIDLLRAAHPGSEIRFAAQGDSMGSFDESRVREALANLVSNAIKHGEAPEPCVVSVEGLNSRVRIAVQNRGNLPRQEIEPLFEPLRGRYGKSAPADRTHLGLGLFIARQIARAHGGEVTGHCQRHTVRFVIELPRESTDAEHMRADSQDR